MRASEDWIESAEARAKELETHGVYWRHDGNPKRPYVRLRSGLLSNGYFNGGIICEWPDLLDWLVDELVEEYAARYKQSGEDYFIDRVVGPAMGAITLAHSTARSLSLEFDESGVFMSFAEKDKNGGFGFNRNPPKPGETILFVEDTVTTFETVLKVRDAVLRIIPDAVFSPFVIVLCNRTGLESIEGFEIISLVAADFTTWKEGENPFTPDGKELVPPVENAKENWDELTREYV